MEGAHEALVCVALKFHPVTTKITCTMYMQCHASLGEGMSSPHILVVEDDPVIREILVELLDESYRRAGRYGNAP